jgi:uncharacterized membrane protein
MSDPTRSSGSGGPDTQGADMASGLDRADRGKIPETLPNAPARAVTSRRGDRPGTPPPGAALPHTGSFRPAARVEGASAPPDNSPAVATGRAGPMPRSKPVRSGSAPSAEAAPQAARQEVRHSAVQPNAASRPAAETEQRQGRRKQAPTRGQRTPPRRSWARRQRIAPSMSERARFLLATLCGLVLGAGVHIAIVLLLPRFAEQDAFSRLRGTMESETAVMVSGTGGAETWMPFADPAVAVAACAYDLEDGPVRISAKAGALFQSLSFHSRAGGVYFALTDRAAVRGDLEAVIMTRRQLDEALAAEDEEDPTRDVRIVAPQREGLVIVRVVAPAPSFRPQADEAAKSVLCTIEGQEETLGTQVPPAQGAQPRAGSPAQPVPPASTRTPGQRPAPGTPLPSPPGRR